MKGNVASKIRKLEALAGNNPNAEEATAAREKARALAERHGIALHGPEYEKFIARHIAWQLRKRRRSKDPIKQKLNEAIAEVFNQPHVLRAFADLDWQRRQIKQHMHSLGKTGVCYADLKNFVVKNGWESNWIKSRRLQGWWASMHRLRF